MQELNFRNIADGINKKGKMWLWLRFAITGVLGTNPLTALVAGMKI